MKTLPRLLACFCLLTTLIGVQPSTSYAGLIQWLDGTNGTVPGTTISYTISGNFDNELAISAGSTNDGDHTWNAGGSRYAKSGSDITTTISFSEPIRVDAFTTLAIDFASGMDTISVAGGTATVADFALDPGLFGTAEFTYNSANGQLSRSDLTGNRNDGQLVGISPATILSLTHTSTGVASGDATEVTFGVFSGVAIPEPSSFLMLGLICGTLSIAGTLQHRSRKRAGRAGEDEGEGSVALP